MNVHYQPIVELQTQEVVRAEAFCRLGEGALGAIAASEFIPHAERNGLMRELTECVVNQVLTDRRSWSLDLPVSINISQSNLFESDFCERVIAMLAKYETDPSLVTFELADGVQSTLSTEEREAMHRLAVMGVRFSLDGFDLNRSDFTVLRVSRLPLCELKIDAKLLALGQPPNHAVRRVMAFAEETHLDVVVKSVETPEEIAKLRELGCTLAQGYAFGAPMESFAFDEWLSQKVAA